MALRSWTLGRVLWLSAAWIAALVTYGLIRVAVVYISAGDANVVTHISYVRFNWPLIAGVFLGPPVLLLICWRIAGKPSAGSAAV